MKGRVPNHTKFHYKDLGNDLKRNSFKNYTKKCPMCDSGVLKNRNGKFGFFIGCSNYPKCDYSKKSTKFST